MPLRSSQASGADQAVPEKFFQKNTELLEICIWFEVYAYIHMCVCIHACSCVCIHTPIHIYTFISMCLCIYIHTNTYIQYIDTYVYMCTHIHTYTCIYTQIYIHIHTFIHTIWLQISSKCDVTIVTRDLMLDRKD